MWWQIWVNNSLMTKSMKCWVKSMWLEMESFDTKVKRCRDQWTCHWTLFIRFVELVRVCMGKWDQLRLRRTSVIDLCIHGHFNRFYAHLVRIRTSQIFDSNDSMNFSEHPTLKSLSLLLFFNWRRINSVETHIGFLLLLLFIFSLLASPLFRFSSMFNSLTMTTRPSNVHVSSLLFSFRWVKMRRLSSCSTFKRFSRLSPETIVHRHSETIDVMWLEYHQVTFDSMR